MMDELVYLIKLLIMFGISGVIPRSVVAEMNFTFERAPKNYEIFEGATVRLMCLQELQDPLTISRDGTIIVKNAVFVGSPSKYSFHQAEPNNIFILTILEVEKSDRGRYFCEERIPLIKQLFLDVLYHPSSGPYCTSSYDPLKSYFDDVYQQKFYFNCTVGEGNPQIDITLFKDGESRERIHVDGTTLINTTGQDPQKTLMFSSYLNNSFNNSRLTCVVVQQIPPTFVGYDFNKSCSYGPMTLLQTFDISVTPFNVTVQEGDATLVTCSSNVSGVEKRWGNIPEDLVYETEEDDDGLHLKILEAKAVDNQPVILVCECLFGGRQLSAEVTIYIQRNDHVHRKTSPIIVALLILLLVSVIAISLVLISYCYKRRFKQRHRKNGKNDTANNTEESLKMKKDRL